MIKLKKHNQQKTITQRNHRLTKFVGGISLCLGIAIGHNASAQGLRNETGSNHSSKVCHVMHEKPDPEDIPWFSESSVATNKGHVYFQSIDAVDIDTCKSAKGIAFSRTANNTNTVKSGDYQITLVPAVLDHCSSSPFENYLRVVKKGVLVGEFVIVQKYNHLQRVGNLGENCYYHNNHREDDKLYRHVDSLKPALYQAGPDTYVYSNGDVYIKMDGMLHTDINLQNYGLYVVPQILVKEAWNLPQEGLSRANEFDERKADLRLLKLINSLKEN